MKRYNFEIKMDIEEHVPILIQAQGRDLESLIEDAEYSVDCPDPKNFYNIAELSQRSYDRAVEKLNERVREAQEARGEAR